MDKNNAMVKEALSLLRDFNYEVEDFVAKASPGGFLRTATISHLNYAMKRKQGKREELPDATQLLDEWLAEQRNEPNT